MYFLKIYWAVGPFEKSNDCYDHLRKIHVYTELCI